MRLTYPENAVIVAAGLPGAGKSILIRGAGQRASHVRHYGHIVTAVWGRQPVVIHSRGTLGTLRRLITPASSLRGRPAS